MHFQIAENCTQLYVTSALSCCSLMKTFFIFNSATILYIDIVFCIIIIIISIILNSVDFYSSDKHLGYKVSIVDLKGVFMSISNQTKCWFEQMKFLKVTTKSPLKRINLFQWKKWSHQLFMKWIKWIIALFKYVLWKKHEGYLASLAFSWLWKLIIKLVINEIHFYH